MEKKIILDSLVIVLSQEGSDVRVKSDNENVILSKQTIDTVYELIEHNYNRHNEHLEPAILGSYEEPMPPRYFVAIFQ